jgi:hypothetical protein
VSLGLAVHLTLPKGGSHWVTDVLSDERVLTANPGLHFQRCEDYRLDYCAAQKDGFFTGPMFSISYEEWKPFRRPGFKAIHVGRDPRDAIVSMTFSFAYSHETQPHIELIRPVLLASDMRTKLMIGMYQYWQSSWIERSWASIPSSEFEYTTTYERVVANEFQEFRAMFDFLGWTVSDETLRDIVEYHSFERRARGRERGQENRFSHYRRGVAGDWTNFFDRKLGEMFERACPNLLVELGYEQDRNWYERLPEQIDELTRSADEALDTVKLAIENKELYAEREALAGRLRDLISTIDDLERLTAASNIT